MRIFWLNLLPDGGTPAEPDDTRDRQAERAQNFCRERSVLGMGWSVTPSRTGELLSWDDYLRLRAEHEDFDDRKNVIRWKEDVSIGDLVWTKTVNERFWLARITGDWHYDLSAAAKKADMVNQRPAMIVEIGGRKAVPQRVAKGGRQTLEEMHVPEGMGEVPLLLDRSQVVEAVERYPTLLPENLADFCALWQPLRGADPK